jgi:hypothetical protein
MKIISSLKEVLLPFFILIKSAIHAREIVRTWKMGIHLEELSRIPFLCLTVHLMVTKILNKRRSQHSPRSPIFVLISK